MFAVVFAVVFAHIDHAILSGKFLSAVKEECGHGNFLVRLEVLGIPERTAQDYIRLSKDVSNTRQAAHLGVKAALKYLACDEETKAVIDEKIDNGESVTAAEIAKLLDCNKVQKAIESPIGDKIPEMNSLNWCAK